MPGGDRRPAGVVYPASTAEVQAIVRLANKHKCRSIRSAPATISGSARARRRRAGQVVVDLGRRMNRILEIDEKLAFAVVEPGVSYQKLYDELVRRGNQLMLDVTSGPPQGGMIGNALDKGAGYTPYFDHFGFSCGIEIVLGNGEMLRTGDGALDSETLVNWHTSKYSASARSSTGCSRNRISASSRAWACGCCRSRRRCARSTSPSPTTTISKQIIELCRPLKLSNFVPTLFRVSNDLYLCGSEGESAEYAASQRQAIDLGRGAPALREKHGLGAWNVSGAFYGPSMAALEPHDPARARSFRAKRQGANTSRTRRRARIPPLQVAINAFSGIPSLGELGLLKWRPGGGNIWFLPGTPMDGKIANEFQSICRKIYEELGLDYMVMNVCGPRFARGLHVHDVQPRGCRRARARRCLLSRRCRSGRQARRVRRPRAGRLSRLPHARRRCRHSATPAPASRRRSIRTA